MIKDNTQCIIISNLNDDKQIKELRNNLGEPVYIKNICKYGWVGYKIKKEKKEKINYFENFCKEIEIKEETYIKDYWKQYKTYLLEKYKIKEYNRQKFKKQVFLNFYNYCNFYKKYYLINSSCLATLLELNLEKDKHNKISVLELWSAIKENFPNKFSYKDKKELIGILKEEPYNMIDKTINYKFKYPIINEPHNIVSITCNRFTKEIIKLKKHEKKPINYTYSAQGINYFNHSQIINLLNHDSPLFIRLFDDSIKVIDRNDYRPMFIRRNSRLYSAYGEFAERVVYDILKKKELKASITTHFDDIFISDGNVYDELTNNFLSIKFLIDKHIANNNLIIQPTIRANNYVIRPDLILNDTVYDIKEIHSLKQMNKHISFQLLFYFSILERTKCYNVTSMGIIVPNKSVIIKFNMSEWIQKNMSSKFLMYLRILAFKTDTEGNILTKCYDVPQKNNNQKELYNYLVSVMGPLLPKIKYTIMTH